LEELNLNEQILEAATYWSKGAAFDSATHDEIGRLLQQDNKKELTERFYRDLEFGTGGLRGIIGAGTARMNVYNVRKASFAFASYLKELHGTKALKISVTYDSRRFSKEFARAASEVFAACGVKTLITKELRPVPMLSFMVRKYGCDGGVCITASHNPPDYNGYKVYWSTGGQLIPPHDTAVIKKYADIKRYEDIPHITFQEGLSNGLIEEVGAELDEAYFKQVTNLSLSSKGREDFKIVYTPLHGSGLYPVTECLKRFGFKNVSVVPEQREPDGNFPTVKFPNPEDPDALELALKLAKKEQADLVLATDPDADRVGIIVREGDSYTTLNGNQIGSLLIDYVLSGLKGAKRLPDNPLVIKTIVTTDLQNDIAAAYGAACEETLTGFKWICGLIEEYESGQRKPYKQYVCGGEESYGFLADHFVRDKDGVAACCIAAEMVAHYKSLGKTLSDVLDELYTRHGLYQESLFTITMPGMDGAAAIKTMMQRLRQDPPKAIEGISVDIMRDFELRQESRREGSTFKHSGALPLPKSDVLQFILQDGTKVSVLRVSKLHLFHLRRVNTSTV
jgi:phosphoglucomutase